MIEPGAVDTPTRRRRPAAAVFLVALWLAWAASAFVFAPRLDDGHQLRDDLRRHQVTAFNTVAQPPAGPIAMMLGAGNNDTSAGYVVWQVENQRRRYAEFPTALNVLSEFAKPDFPANASDLAIVQNSMVKASGVHAVGMGGPTPVIALGFLLHAAALVCLVTVPVRTGTRWYWFWLTTLVGGLGALAFVVTELLRTRPARRPPRRGLRGLIVAFLLNSVLMTIGNVMLGLGL